jgi:hypothetical protein
MNLHFQFDGFEKSYNSGDVPNATMTTEASFYNMVPSGKDIACMTNLHDMNIGVQCLEPHHAGFLTAFERHPSLTFVTVATEDVVNTFRRHPRTRRFVLVDSVSPPCEPDGPWDQEWDETTHKDDLDAEEDSRALAAC